MIPDLDDKTQKLFYISEYGVDDLDTIRYFSSAIPPIGQSDSHDQSSMCLVTSYLNDIVHDSKLGPEMALAAEQSLQYLAEQEYPSAQIQYGELMNERGNVKVAIQFFDKTVHNTYYENETHKELLKKRIQCMCASEQMNEASNEKKIDVLSSSYACKYENKSPLRDFLRNNSRSQREYSSLKQEPDGNVVPDEWFCHRGR